MPAITPTWLMSLEKNMRVITNRDYDRLNRNMWWPQVAKRITTGAAAERMIWLLDTARIQRTGRGGGNIEFEDIVSTTTEIETENAAAGLKIKKEKFEDVDGRGVELAAHWSRTIGAYAAYWPQKCLAKAILANPVTYDGKAFFATDHPNNPYNPSAGTFANLFTGAASGTYPGACPIDSSVTLDVAINNLSKVLAYIGGVIKMPNGEDPRFLKVTSLFVPPALVARATQITNAKFIAQAAGGAAGSGDIEAVVRNFGLGQPVEVPELGAAFGGDDKTYYLGLDELTSNELGAFTYLDREPFSVLYYGPMNDAQLARIREFQWMTEGRNAIGAGHPFLLMKCAGS